MEEVIKPITSALLGTLLGVSGKGVSGTYQMDLPIAEIEKQLKEGIEVKTATLELFSEAFESKVLSINLGIKARPGYSTAEDALAIFLQNGRKTKVGEKIGIALIDSWDNRVELTLYQSGGQMISKFKLKTVRVEKTKKS